MSEDSTVIRGGGTTVRIVNRKLSGAPWAEIATSPAKTDLGASQVQVIIRSIGVGNERDCASVAATMTMSAAKARELAAQLIASADKADAL